MRWQIGLADQLPLEDASADRVVHSLLLHHLPPDAKRRALTEAIRVLRPGGRLHVADWGRPPGWIHRAGFGALRLLDGVDNTRDHAAGRLPQMMSNAGLRAIAGEARLPTVWGTLELLRGEVR